MSESVPVLLRIRDSAREPTPAVLEIDQLSLGKRMQRGVIRLAVCWALAVACVFIPLLHFVLVPGFLLVGPVLAWLAMRATVVVKTANVTCPKCAKETAVEPGTTGWPAGLRCAHCSTTFAADPAHP